MQVDLTRKDKEVTVKLIGRMDTPAAMEAAAELEPLKEEASGTIVMDCSELTYISSSGLRIFLSLRKAAAVKGGKIIVKSISDDIRQVFMMTGFLNLFQIED